ncbi:MAG: hypothetical protein IIZ59_01615, partial [Clostridia bacterium]|nr:hypothetical protein [Clostridia bacterium]
MLDASNGGKKPTDRVKFQMNDTITLVLENEFCKIYRDTRSSKPFKVINGEIVPIELRELNMWKGRQKTPTNFVVKPLKDERGLPYDYIITRVARGETPVSEPEVNAAPAPAPAAPAAPIRAAARPAPAPAQAQRPMQQAGQRPAMQKPSANSAPTVITISDSEKESRIKFEQTADIDEIFSNEFFHAYRDKVRGRTFKVINGEVANIEVRELNFWKNRIKNPGGFIVTIVNDSHGQPYDYRIERNPDAAPGGAHPAPGGAPAAQQQPMRPAQNAPQVPNNATTSQQPMRSAQNAPQMPNDVPVSQQQPIRPAQNAPQVQNNAQTAQQPARSAPPAQAPAPQHRPARGGASKVTEMTGEKPDKRVIFVDNDTTEMVLENEYCKFYKDKRASKVFKVVDGEIAPIELRELNWWKNRTKNPGDYSVTIMKDSSGKPYDYIISRINEDGTLTAAPTVAVPQPVIMPDTPEVPVMPQRAQIPTPPPKPAAVVSSPKPSVPTGKPAGAPAPTKETITQTNMKRVKFDETPSMKLLLENEYFKIYSDSRRGATFKVINDEIVPLPQRELNMWKNRQRRPKEFAVKEIHDQQGNIYDYEITRTTNVTAAVATTTTKTNLPPVTERLNVGGNKRRPNSSRKVNCALCGKEYKESELMLFGNKNICSECMETLVNEKLFANEHVDPIQKNIDDIVGADEIYCTYSLVTNYPYLNEEFCVNVCTIKRAAEIGAEDTIAQTIDEKGDFFDDLKRFGLKKIIVNNDQSHVYSPEDFDVHVKSEGIIAPKLYFKVLNYMQHGDDSLRTAIAESFLGSKVYTYALDSDITEITDENADDFKPLTFTDGINSFCPVFTDLTEARSVGMPFKGLYEIETRLLAFHKITHFIINPQSLGFIMNKTILEGAKPNYDRAVIDENDDRIKNYDSYVNPFEVENVVLAQLEAEKAEAEAKKLQEIRDAADEAVAAATARAEAAEKDAEKARHEAEAAHHEAEEAQHIADDAKHEAEDARRAADEAVHNADEAMKTARLAEEARAAATERAAAAEKAVEKKEAEIAEAAEKAKAEVEAKYKAEAEARVKAAVPFGVPLAAAAAFAGKNTSAAPDTAPAAGQQKKTPPAGIFMNNDEDKKSPLDALNLNSSNDNSMPSLDLSDFSANPPVSAPAPAAPKEEAAPNSFFKPQGMRNEEPMAPLNDFKKSNIYGNSQVAKNNGYNQPNPYDAAQRRTPDYAAPTQPLQQKRVQQPAQQQNIVINSVSDNGDGKVKKSLKVSMPLFIADVPDDEIEITPYSDNLLTPPPTSDKRTKGPNTVLNEMAKANENNNSFDLSSLMYGDAPAPAAPKKAAPPTIQEQCALIKAIARDLDMETNPIASRDVREKLDNCYRDLAKLIAEANVMYAEFDAHTRHILIDGNNKGHIFSEKALAEKSVENFAKAGINVYLQEYTKKDIFNMLFEYRRHGIQELVLDETAHWVILQTDKISEMLDVYERDYVKIPVMNPELMFSMTTLSQ